jgi:hypothetical protein
LDLNNGDAAAAKAKFEIAKDEMGRRDYFRVRICARAYMNADKPDFKAAIQTL